MNRSNTRARTHRRSSAAKRQVAQQKINVRARALAILEQFDRRQQSLDALIERMLPADEIESRDRRFALEIVQGILQHRTALDYAICQFLNNERFEQNAHLIRLLELGAYQLNFMDRVPHHAAVNETVSCAKQDKRTGSLSGVVNGVLRTMIRQKGKMPQPTEKQVGDLVARLSIIYSHPEWMVRRWLDNFGLGRTKKLLEFNNTRPEIFLRRSSRRITRQQFEADSRELCVSSGGFMNLYYRLTQPIPPEKIALLREGYCTVQAPSSGWVVAMLKPERNQRLLDVCSAPGGKTSLLAELAGESGAVCACEIRMYRLRRMIDTIGRLQLHNVYPVLCNGINLPFAGSFDSVLLDAPCSGTGVLHRHPDGRWIKTPEHIERIVSAQQRLLDGAAPFVVPGGVLVYATCSLEPEENHRQISSFLQRQPDFELESPPAAVPQKFIDNEGCLFVTPFEHGMDGMFAARLRKHT